MFIVDIEKKKKKKNMKVNNKKIKRRTFINGNNCYIEFPRTKDDEICLVAALFIA